MPASDRRDPAEHTPTQRCVHCHGADHTCHRRDEPPPEGPLDQYPSEETVRAGLSLFRPPTHAEALRGSRAAPHRPRCPAVRRRAGRGRPRRRADRAAGQPGGPDLGEGHCAGRDRRPGACGWSATGPAGSACSPPTAPGHPVSGPGCRPRPPPAATWTGSAPPSGSDPATSGRCRSPGCPAATSCASSRPATGCRSSAASSSRSSTARAGCCRCPARPRARPARHRRTDVEASTAARTARRAVAARHGVPGSTLVAGRPTRWLLDRSLVEPSAAPALRSVWRVPVRSRTRLDVADLVLVDARSGRVALRLAEVAGAGPRRLRRPADPVLPVPSRASTTGSRAVRRPASPTPTRPTTSAAPPRTGTPARLGVDLTALIGSDFGDGRKLRSTTNYCPPGACPLDNAFWSGNQMVYGAGYTSADDVVAHELTHGVTQHTAGLVYWYQSGSINESMSDVFGELVDQADGIGHDEPGTRWRLGEDLPPTAGGATRDMADPTRYLQPDTTSSPMFDFAQDYDDSGAVHTNSGVPNKAAYLITDGTVAEPGGAFLGRAFPGIGPTHAATLYWTALQMLTPGSDFVDLAAALQQACTTLAFAARGVRHSRRCRRRDRPRPVGRPDRAARRPDDCRPGSGADLLVAAGVVGVGPARLVRRGGDPCGARRRLRGRRADGHRLGADRAEAGRQLHAAADGGDRRGHLARGGADLRGDGADRLGPGGPGLGQPGPRRRPAAQRGRRRAARAAGPAAAPRRRLAGVPGGGSGRRPGPVGRSASAPGGPAGAPTGTSGTPGAAASSGSGASAAPWRCASG